MAPPGPPSHSVGRTSRSAPALLVRLLVLSAPFLAQAQIPGPQVATFHSDVDNSDQPYALYLPKTFDPAQKYPLVVSLHAEESDHRLNLRQLFGKGILGAETMGEAARRFPPLPDVPFIVACPLARGAVPPGPYRGIAEKDIYDMLADVERRFPVDPDRVYLTGVSVGGGAALRLALTRPDIWAAVAPVCAEPPSEMEALAGNALNLPILLFHGEQDPIVSAQSSRRLQKRFLDLGAPAEYVEYPALRHNAWDRAYRNAAIFDVLGKFHRRRFPDRVRFTTSQYKYTEAYWVRLDRLTPGQPAAVDARFAALNRIEVATHDLDGLTLSLAGHPQFSGAHPLSVTIDGTTLHPKGRDTVSFVRSGNSWTPGFAPLLGAVKRPGLEGPLAEAIASRHIYVYGESAADHDAAATAAQWSTPRGQLLVSFPVMADKDVTAEDIATANLILFGSRQTNSLIARFAGRLPLELNPSAADYGLVFIAGIGAHYVVVNSGLPWWTGAAQVKRSGWRQTPAPYHVLESLGDYVLFRGSLEHVVAEGRFDRNWRLPAAQEKPLAESGAVTIPPCCQKSFAATATK